MAFIVDNWAYTVIIRPQPPFNRWLESLEIGLYAQFLFYKGTISGVAGIAKKCYKPKIVETRGGWKLSKALYAQNDIFSIYGSLYGRNYYYNSDFLRYRIKPEFLSKFTLIIPIMTRNMT